jgi:molybdopterin-containing oxidoreductase family iron-sulfur binding subunit
MHDCVYRFGAMRVLLEDPKYYQDFPIGSQDAVPSLENTVKKCNFCTHRIDKGLLPMCVSACPAKARFFGDINDPRSKVSKLTKNKDYKILPVEAGRKATNPSVFFLKA